MIHLQTEHLIVKDVILGRFRRAKNEKNDTSAKSEKNDTNEKGEKGDKKPKYDTVDVRVCDFDDAQYHVLVTSEQPNVMKVSASVRGSSKVLNNPAYRAVFDEYFGAYACDETENLYDVTLAINLENLPASDQELEALATQLARLKRYIIGAPLLAMGRALDSKAPLTECLALEVRLGEYIYFVPRVDRVTVIFDLSFKDPTDTAIAKVFVQGFAEVGKSKSFATAPIPMFMPTPPSEILDSPELAKTVSQNQDRIGYLSFAVLARHVVPSTLDNTVDRFVQFRGYLHYHIKCSKSQMHSRMRKRVEHLLQVLNRAIPDVPKGAEARHLIVATAGSAGI